jgi:magnesium chelatase subunit D
VARATRVAHQLRHEGVDAVVVDCESGRMRLGLAARLAVDLGAEHLPVGEVAAQTILDAARTTATPSRRAA